MLGRFDKLAPVSLNFLTTVLIFQSQQSGDSYEQLFCPLHQFISHKNNMPIEEKK
jgi:hypothetical protein